MFLLFTPKSIYGLYYIPTLYKRHLDEIFCEKKMKIVFSNFFFSKKKSKIFFGEKKNFFFSKKKNEIFFSSKDCFFTFFPYFFFFRTESGLDSLGPVSFNVILSDQNEKKMVGFFLNKSGRDLFGEDAST